MTHISHKYVTIIVCTWLAFFNTVFSYEIQPETYCPASIVRGCDLEAAVNATITKIAKKKETKLHFLSYQDKQELNAKKNAIVNMIRLKIAHAGRSYACFYEIETAVRAELSTFFDKHSSKLGTYLRTAFSWLSTFEVKSTFFRQRVINTALDILGLTPETLPAHIVTDFHYKIQSCLYRLQSKATITMDDVHHIIYEEMQPVIDNLSFKIIQCPLCHGQYAIPVV